MRRVTKFLPVTVSIVLVVALGAITFRTSASAEERALATHREDAVETQRILASLANQYLLITAKEAYDFASSAGFSLQPGDPGDRQLLERFIDEASLYDYGAVLVNLNAEVLNAWSEGPLPPADDPGYLTLRQGLLSQQPGVSSLMQVDGVPLVAVGVPLMTDGLPRAVLIGYWRADTSKLQEYNEEIRQKEPHAQGFVVDSRGVVVTGRDRRFIGRSLSDDPALGELDAGRSGAVEFEREDVRLTGAYSPVELGDWAVLKEVPSAELYGPIRDSRRKIDAALVALLAAAATVLIVFNHRIDRARRRGEARFRSLVQNASDVITVTWGDGRIVYDSPAVERVLGYRFSERAGKQVSSYVHAEDAAWLERARRELMRSPGGQVRGEVRVRRQDGSYCWSEVTVSNMLGDAAVRGIVINLRDISDRVALHARLEHQAFHDPLTGLPNRILLSDRLAQALARQERTGRAVAVLFCDLDRFKVVNDSLGHEGGDQVLAAVADRLTRVVRPADTVARVSGDEFVVLLEGVSGEEEPERVANRMLGEMRLPFEVDGQEVFSGMSIGIALAGPDQQPDDVIRDADLAMYRAKERGRLRYEVFAPDIGGEVRQRLQLEAELRRAVEHGELTVHYQPEVDLVSGHVVGVEALLRWDHPERGLLPAGQFVAAAEGTGLIVPMGARVLEEACRQAGEWRQRQSGAPQWVSVNVSGHQLLRPAFAELVASALDRSGLPPGALTLELTESVLMGDPELAVTRVHDLHALGVRLAIDDFGTGYSSLAYLKNFPVSVLKLDRSFVLGLGSDGTDMAITEAIIGLAHSLGKTVTAEGVELPEQLERLRAMGCDRAQGFLLARPAPADEVEMLLGEPLRVAVGA